MTNPWQQPTLGVSFASDSLYLRVYDAAGRLKPLPQEADALLLEQAATLVEQAATLERARALTAAGDLAALRALLGLSAPGDEPG